LSGALLRLQWRRHRAVLVLMPLGLFAFEWLVTRIVPSPDQTAQLRAILAYLPPPMLQAMGFRDPMSVTTQGVLGFAYAHPVVFLLLGLWTVRVTARGLSGEIGAGTMDLLASRSVARHTVVLTVAATTAAGVVIGVLAAWAGTALGLASRDLGPIRGAEFAPMVLGLALLFVAWAGVTLFVSAVQRQGGGTIAIVAGIMAATFALDYLARAWEPIRALRALSPFAYYEPQLILQQGLAPGAALVLAGIAVAGLALALLAFRRRDL
jgi:ABC-type transport system involved in multi-copper enzyme maturation permease subunit